MICFNIFQLFLILKLCSGMRYIDLKNNFISDGVEVQHGYFMTSGKYRMFHARDPPLEIVQFGATRVFPDNDYITGTHSLYVEQFKVGDEEALSIYVFRHSVTSSNVVYKVYFQMAEFGYKLIDCAKFTEMIKGKIHVSLDLSRSKSHPFFNIHTKEEHGVATTLIEIRKSIAGYRLRNVEAKRYEFGRIIDSAFPIYMGYSKLNMFLTKATSIYIHKEEDKNYIVLRHWTKNIRFDLTMVNGILAWNAVTDPEPSLSEEMHQKVYKVRDRIDGYKSLNILSTLDLAENIAPELVGIEKVTGRHGGASYILYHIELGRDIKNKIKFVINSEMMDMLIAKIDDRTLHTKVEIITNSHRTFVIITCLMKIDLVYETVINYYDKPNMENTNYYHIPEPYQTKIVSDMYKRYPIQINLDIDDPPSIVDHGEMQYEGSMLKYYRIKGEDGRGSVLEGRYVFGDIWQNDLHEIGNIPYEGNKRRFKVIAHSVNTSRIIVKAKNTDFPILPEEMQEYLIIEWKRKSLHTKGNEITIDSQKRMRVKLVRDRNKNHQSKRELEARVPIKVTSLRAKIEKNLSKIDIEMTIIVCVLAMMLVKCNCTKMYVDVKINFISEGVVVHHGTYLKNGSYKMFLGEKDPLEQVYYGNARLYPPRLDKKDPNEHQLIVELFNTGTRRFVLVHNYSFLGDSPVGYGRIFFELGMDTYIEVDMPSMVSVITATVHLSVDIGPKHRHPFIMRTVQDLTTERKVTYKVVDSFNRIPLDGINAPKYAIGYVYDSTAATVIGYTKMNYLHDKCLSFTVDYKFNAEKVTIKTISYILIYERRTILNVPVWYLVLRPESTFLSDEVKNALAVYEKLENHWERYMLVTVDISDNVTSDLYALEKVMGIAGEWKYSLYQVKREFINTYQIRAVVDLTTQIVKIHRVDKIAANTTVEVYSSADDTVVIVTSYLKHGMIQDKEVEVYEKSNTNYIGFSKMVEPAKTNVLESFMKLYPINLGVVIGDKPNAIYGRKEISGGQFKFLYFYLRDSDFRGSDLRHKYRFAYVWERNPYECGNVTVDGWIKRTRVVSRELNTRKFMIRNTYTALPVDVKSYEIYQLM